MADPFKDIQPISPRPKGASIGLTEPDAGAGGPSKGGRFGLTLGERRAAQAKPASQFALPKSQPQYEIWQRADSFGRPARKVSEAANLQSARRVIDRRDNDYGAYVHYHKKIGE